MKKPFDLAQESIDAAFMRRALALAEQARTISPPNPWVGCVIVNHGAIVGEGHTQPAGQDHAEAAALKSAGGNAAGGTAYVTLEPCCHYGRTPPCVHSLIKAKIQRVVVAVEDPDPHVSGKGLSQLRDAGIDLSVGICAEEAVRSLQPYIHHRKTSRPYCIIKTAMSLDGRTAAADGTSKWITPPEARLNAHQLRAQSQAIIIGSGTALADNPRLTVRDIGPMPIRPPLRVLLDASGRVLPPKHLFNGAEAPTLIITSDRCCDKTLSAWRECGMEVAVLPNPVSQQGIDFRHVLDFLGKRGIIQALVEGGASLEGSIAKQNLFDQLAAYVGPIILGDSSLPVFKNIAISTMKEAHRLKLIDVQRMGDCVRLDYVPTGEMTDR